MRLQISHETTFRFETPAHYAVQLMRLTPRGSSQQFVNDWRIDVSADCKLTPVEDPYGNWTHTFSIDGPIDELVIAASGEVMTEETNGIVRGTPERLPISVYLRQTPHTTADPTVRQQVISIKAKTQDDPLSILHALMSWVATNIDDDLEPQTRVPTPANVLAAARGTPRDRSHLFIAAARELEIPARFVTGYIFGPDTPALSSAVHAWTEAYAGPGLGWIGFDPTLDVCPTEAHVRVAASLDYLDALPVRGSHLGRPMEAVSSKVTIREAAARSRRHAVAK